MVRNSSFELLRIISIFLIVLCHVCALMDWDNASLLNKLIVGVVNSVGNIAVSCFVLISGYFGVKFKWRKFVNLIVITTVYCTIVAAFRFGNNPMELAMAFLTVPMYGLWFIVCYLILMPLAPYINKFTETLNRKEFRNLIIILVILLCVIPTLSIKGATNGIVLQQGGKCFVYFVFLYILGRYIKLQNDIEYKRSNLIVGHLLCTVIVFSLNVVISCFLNRRFVIFRFDCSPFILLSALCVFYLFKSWNFHNKVINWFSDSVFAFYLLSNIYYYVDLRWIHLRDVSSGGWFTLYLIVLVICAWLFSLVIDKTLGVLINYMMRKFEDWAEPKILNNKLYKRVIQ